MKRVQVGIDLGTTNTLACCEVKGKKKLIKFKGGNMLPSILYVEKQADGSIKESVGRIAKNKGALDPDNCIRSSKTYIGLTGKNKKSWVCQGKTYTPTDVATKILEEVHSKVRDLYDLEKDDMVEAVITIPAYFTSSQSDETKRAGERAGMVVRRIITEPVAAAVSEAEDVKGKIMVVDLGGGTFDVSVLNISDHRFETLEINGERRLGGDDFDDLLVKDFLMHIEDDLGINLSSQAKSGLSYEDYNLMMSKIRDAAVETKIELSDSDEYEIDIPGLFPLNNGKSYDFAYYMTREDFNALCKPLFDKIMKVIKETVTKSKKFKKSELTKIYLVGGSCYIPKIQEDVEAYFGMSTDSSQDRAVQVAMGAGMIAAACSAMTDDENYKDPFSDSLVDIISHSMGIEIVGNKWEKQYSELLPKGKEYPCTFSDEYTTASDNQTSVIIKVYEKTEEDASNLMAKNENAFDLYGSFELTGIKPAPAGATPIRVTFNYDQSRTLNVTAEDLISGVQQTVILHKGVQLVEENPAQKTDFYILLDISGSMSGSRINEAKRACRKLILETLDLSVHRLGIIVFGSRAQEVCELTNNKKKLIAATDAVTTYGSTNMRDAFTIAEDKFMHTKNQKAVILITDGGPDNASGARNAAASLKSNNVKVATIGVEGADMGFLRSITGDKALCFEVKNLAQLADTFGKAVENLLRK